MECRLPAMPENYDPASGRAIYRANACATSPGLDLATRLLDYAGDLCRQSAHEAMDALLQEAVRHLLHAVCPQARFTLHHLSCDLSEPVWPEEGAGRAYRLYDDSHGEPSLSLSIHAVQALPDDALVLLQSLISLYRAHRDVVRRGMTDALTGLMNRTAFETLMPPLLAGERRQGRRASAVTRRRDQDSPAGDWVGVLDLDHFKAINDRYGHAGGDKVLRTLAVLLRSQFRARDSLFRIGGEEFVVVLRQSALEDAREAFERLRRGFAEQVQADGCHTTLSLGAACVRAGDDLAALMRRADQALYRAKNSGRNRVVFA